MIPISALIVVIAATFGLSAFQALGSGAVFVISGLLFKSRIAKKYSLLKPVLAACIWCVFEWCQTLFWFGVPWARLVLGQTEYTVSLQTVSLFGTYFITFLLVSVNFFLAYAFINAERIKLCASLCALLMIGNFTLGSIVYFTDTDSDRYVLVAALQGNIPSSEKWDFSVFDKTEAAYERQVKLAAESGAQMIVYPETAIPYTLSQNSSMSKYIKGISQNTGATLLVGGFTNDPLGRGDYNSVVAFTPDGNMNDTVYSKRKPVPFGEYVPGKEIISTLIPPLASLVMSEVEIVAGEGTNVIELEEGKIGALVCFDSIYDSLARESVRDGAELLTVSTNDSWFSDSAALYMHNAQARLRAIENGRYVIRAASTGVSSFISPTGKVLDTVAPLTEGYSVMDVYMLTERTAYSYIGNLFVYLCLGFTVGVFSYNFALRVRSKIQK
jgi:apolipoprotein N-acyltransferase